MQRDCDSRCLSKIMTGEEIWVLLFCEPDGKENRNVWILENSERLVITSRTKSVKHVVPVLFLLSRRGKWLKIPVPEGPIRHRNVLCSARAACCS